jgi:hypothetical protein
MRSQNERLLATLQTGASVTPHYALHMLSIGRLAARILELKQAGEDIRDEWVEVQNVYGEACRVKRYFMVRAA